MIDIDEGNRERGDVVGIEARWERAGAEADIEDTERVGVGAGVGVGGKAEEDPGEEAGVAAEVEVEVEAENVGGDEEIENQDEGVEVALPHTQAPVHTVDILTSLTAKFHKFAPKLLWAILEAPARLL